MDVLESLYIKNPSEGPGDGFSSDPDEFYQTADEDADQGERSGIHSPIPAQKSESLARGDFSRLRRERAMLGKQRRKIRFIAPREEDDESLSSIALTPRDPKGVCCPGSSQSGGGYMRAPEDNRGNHSSDALPLGSIGSTRSSKGYPCDTDRKQESASGRRSSPWFKGWMSTGS